MSIIIICVHNFLIIIRKSSVQKLKTVINQVSLLIGMFICSINRANYVYSKTLFDYIDIILYNPNEYILVIVQFFLVTQ